MDKYQFMDKVKEILGVTAKLSVIQEYDLNKLFETVIDQNAEEFGSITDEYGDAYYGEEAQDFVDDLQNTISSLEEEKDELEEEKDELEEENEELKAKIEDLELALETYESADAED